MASDQHISVSFEDFCDIYKEHLWSLGVSPHLFRALHYKLQNEIFDAGDFFCLTIDEESEERSLKAVVSAEDGVRVSDANSIFLVDHMWSYKLCNVREQLCQAPGLVSRLSEMMGYSVHGECFDPDDDIVKTVAEELWKYNQTYSLPATVASQRDDRSVWYVLDEFGSRIRHSDEPSVAMVPFYYQPTQTTFSLFWPLYDLDYGDAVTRDFANCEKNPLVRKCRLLPWQLADLSDVPTKPELLSDEKYQERFNFAKESMPDESECYRPDKKKLKVFMDLHANMLTDDESFELVSSEDEADVVYTKEKISDFRKLSHERPGVLVSQFPSQTMVSCKDLFADVARRAKPDEDGPAWLPLTFNLHYNLPQFCSYFQRSAKEKKDQNCWICKPWNMARSVGTHVTNSLNEVVRLTEMEVPMIASKYVERQVLFHRDDIDARVKFDFTYTILLSSVTPLRLHAYKHFFMRFGNKPFSLDHFDDYAKHFTVMNYVGEGKSLKHVRCEDFIPMFDRQNPGHTWAAVETKLLGAIAEFFRAATARPPPHGIGHYSNSRTMVSVDAILEWRTDEQTGVQQIQPQLLECNFVPDYSRAFDYYPDIMNECFRFLYLGQDSKNFIDISDL